MSKYSQGEFIPKNPQKIVGNATVQYRSSWELRVMMLLDQHPYVINWASESLRIPYINPFTGRQTFYVPDFMVMYKDKDGQTKTDIIEVKPRKQAVIGLARSQQEKAAVVLNMAKWEAAKAWCKKHGANFRVMTEEDIYNRMGEKKR